MLFADVGMEPHQGCLLEWNFQKAADQRQNSLPRKRKAPKDEQELWLHKCKQGFQRNRNESLENEHEQWIFFYRKTQTHSIFNEKESLFPLTLNSQILAYWILVITHGCGLWIRAVKTLSPISWLRRGESVSGLHLGAVASVLHDRILSASSFLDTLEVDT